MRAFSSERGNALIIVLIAVVLVAFLSIAAYRILRVAHESGRTDLALRGQTIQVAESGITEALSWFRQQPRQPVTAFDKPIARDFEVSGGARVWGRYVVDPAGARDVTAARGRGPAGTGTVWEITSTGYLYIRDDPKLAFNVKPNQVTYRLRVTTELQRLAIRPPARGAILMERGESLQILAGGRVRGNNGAAVVYPAGTGLPTVDKNAQVSSESGAPMIPAPSRAPLPPYDLSEVAVLGVRPAELEDLSDVVVRGTEELPERLPQLALIYIDGDAVFTEERPLLGGGILYVNGDLNIEKGSSSSFFGAIYVAGDLSVDAPCSIGGSVIVRGKARVQGVGDISEITYNEDILTVVRRNLGQYRIRRALTRVYDTGDAG